LVLIARILAMIISTGEYSPQLSKNVYIAEGAMVIGQVFLSENSSVWFNSVLRADINYIKIGKGTNIQDLSTLHVTDTQGVDIGENCVVGHNAVIHGATIGNNVLVGMGSIILNGAKIGNNCVIGAGALVLENMAVPDGSLVVGNPAKIKRHVREDELEQIKFWGEKYCRLAKVNMSQQKSI
jgi:carbonic anhydrase/acetyltransferase-like protein (isoleucine patch superfamily)